jgi:putative thiamine transport system permease protein
LATLAIGVVATLVALAATIACLEAEDRSRRRSAWPALLWAPWLVPQIAFVPGIAWILSDLGVRGSFAAVTVSQLVFVFPCVALALIPSWRALDPRYARCAAALRAAPRRVLARVKLPLVARPIAFACALAFAASAGLFLPTRLIVPDRVATLDTDVVSSAATSDSREAMLEATLLALVPAIVVAFALDRRTRATAAPVAWQAAAG